MTPNPAHHPIMLVRHGQTDWSRDGRYQGQSDPPLSAAGIREAERLAETLGVAKIGVIVSSPLRRARQTAAILMKRLGMAGIQVDPDLNEISFGAWEGLTQSEVKQIWPALMRAWKRVPESVRFPGGETLDDVRVRLRRCLAAYGMRAAQTPVLLVTHATWIKLALLEHGAAGPFNFRQIQIATGSVHSLTIHPVPMSPQTMEHLSCVSP